MTFRKGVVHGTTEVFEAKFYQQTYSKSYLKITFCLSFKEKFLKITPLHHILLIFKHFFRQNPLYNPHDLNLHRIFCHFIFQKDPITIFFVFFFMKKSRQKFCNTANFDFSKTEKKLQHTLRETKNGFLVR